MRPLGEVATLRNGENAALRPHIDQPIRIANHVQIMFDNHHRIAQIRQPMRERFKAAIAIAKRPVQPPCARDR
jgi:hypothetical protein